MFSMLLIDHRTTSGTGDFRHAHDDLEFIFIHSGVIVLHIGNWSRILFPGDVLLFDAADLHGGHPATGSYRRTIVYCSKDEFDMDSNSEPSEVLKDGPVLLSLTPEGQAELLQRLSSLSHVLSSSPRGDSRRRRALSEILWQLDRWQKASPRHNRLPRPLFKAVDYMTEHVESGIAISQIAQAVHMSEGALRRLCRYWLGCSLKQLWMQIRIEHAIQLLWQGETVTATAARCGFESRSGFIRAFQRSMGIPPSLCRRPLGPSGAGRQVAARN